MKQETALFAAGCFWGVEYYLQKAEGVIATTVGYTGGHIEKPTYKEVCSGTTGHAEAVKVLYDSEKTNFETLCRLFFETHDPTQLDRQGPDIGVQYRSEVFYTNDEQKTTTEKLINILKEKGLDITTKVTPASAFWEAEGYHQDYYEHKGSLPYCHGYHKLF
jgi:peptide methionine sulfoxide reductase msrA/msrB